MRIGPDGRLHFNLYYIFAEDKENNLLSGQKVEELWVKVLKKTCEKTEI